jgi:hypothetical protein
LRGVPISRAVEPLAQKHFWHLESSRLGVSLLVQSLLEDLGHGTFVSEKERSKRCARTLYES